MPPAGYPAFLQYLQSGRVREFASAQILHVGPWVRLGHGTNWEKWFGVFQNLHE